MVRCGAEQAVSVERRMMLAFLRQDEGKIPVKEATHDRLPSLKATH